MTWFLVDDRLHAHPKALAISLAALGLWTAAGSWSSDHLTDGFMPDHVIPLLSRGTSELADELVAAGLWRRVRGGYQFHEWEADGDGTRRNSTKKEVHERRRQKAEAGRKGGVASGKSRSSNKAPPKAGAEAGASALVEPPPLSLPNDYPPNPPPSGGNDTHVHNGQHANCRACGTNRRGRQPKPEPPPGPSPWTPPDVQDVLHERTNGYEPPPAESVQQAIAAARQRVRHPHAEENP